LSGRGSRLFKDKASEALGTSEASPFRMVTHGEKGAHQPALMRAMKSSMGMAARV